MTATFDAAAVPQLINMPIVVGVSSVPTVLASDERVAIGISSNITATGLPINPRAYGLWLNRLCEYCGNLAGDGFNVGIAEYIGLDGGNGGTHHPDLPAERTQYGTNYYNPSDPIMKDTLGHATLVAGVIGGNPGAGAAVDPGGFFYGTGIAPSTSILLTVWAQIAEQPARTTYTPTLASDAANHSTYVQNHSYNQYTLAASNGPCLNQMDGWYSLVSRDFDVAVRNSDGGSGPPITLTAPTGNIDQQMHDGHGNSLATANCPYLNPTLSLPPGTSKNAISVGGAETVRDPSEQGWNCHGSGSTSYSNVMANGKHGTLNPNWFKPDLMAPASNIVSLQSTAGTQPGFCNVNPQSDVIPAATYLASTGTSFAAPAAAGAAILASRAYAERVRGSGLPSATAASPALIRAMLISAAKSMRGGKDMSSGAQRTIGPLPNGQQGFGRLSVDEILNPYPSRAFVNQSVVLPSGVQTWSHEFRVHDGSLPVKVTLTWTDAPALTNLVNYTSDRTTTPLVNDLDLSVRLGSPCTALYIGNLLEVMDNTKGETSHAYGCPDTVTYDSANNAELVRFFAITDTTFTVTVAKPSGGADQQDFAMVVYNAYDSAAPLTTPRGLSATATNSSTVSLQWTCPTTPASFEIWESSNGQPFSMLGSSTTTSFTHNDAMPGTAQLYRVRAKASNGTYSSFSNIDAAVATLLTDDPLVPGTTIIKASHLSELRQAVNSLRGAVGLSAAAFTDSTLTPGSTVIRAKHVSELRVALNEARTLLGLAPVVFSDDPIGIAVTPVTVAHIQQLRDGVK